MRRRAAWTDCWDVHAALALAAPGFVLLDVRSPECFEQGHIAGAVNLPHRRIIERNLANYPADTVFVVYCAGPHCNGADRTATRLARLGRPVKKMIGGVEGWKDDGFTMTEDARMIMTRRNIQPEALAAPVRGGHTLYSHVVSVEARRLVFVAGQLAFDHAGNVVGKGDMRAQIRQVGENIKAALAAAGATLGDVVKTNTYVTDMDEFFKHLDVRMEYFGPAMPTSTTIEVRRLAHPDVLVEVEVVAMLG